ncbi:zona pellucida sperm-binding protein 4-like [Sinocyclocheilus grahami]|uniref:zona pellucida sperm-binding protein 4-like n=1 Tax=Sinocyclocheilus grahami TaxID=75366 RepID=UPI0007ACB63E|nr:PREDICTED: zona pellucida sperm-binding protein 4-like [Sinocyclocheilus grahami]
MGRIDVEMYDSLNNWSFREFSLACPFFVILSGWFVFYVVMMSCCYFTIVSFYVVVPECFSNGTITVVLPKLESVPHLLPGELSLRGPSCKPSYSQDYYAYFHFGVTTCGTTRKFVEDTMIYENEVTWKSDVPLPETVLPDQEYRYGLPALLL